MEKKMIRTVEAIIDEHGTVRLLEDVDLSSARRALVTILEEEPAAHMSEAALLSQAALARDWDRPEEDAAWSYLQQGP
jgi:cell division GTPase FtsZ